MDDLLNILGITENELALIEMPKVTKQNKDKVNHKNYYSTGKLSTTIGDLLRSQGIE